MTATDGPWREVALEAAAPESFTGPEPEWEHESGWDSPFAAAEGLAEPASEWKSESESPFAAAEGLAEPQSEWESPFATAEVFADPESEWEWESSTPNGEDELWFESEISRPLAFPPTCGQDVRFNNEPWPYGEKNARPQVPGSTRSFTVPRVEWLQVTLTDFDVDRYHLKPAHRTAISQLAQSITTRVANGTIASGGTIWVLTYGGASTTATDQHNLALSRHRAFNALHAVRCEVQRIGIRNPTRYGFFPTGEEEQRAEQGPAPVEAGEQRKVTVRVLATLADPVPCKTCHNDPRPPTPPPTPRPPSTRAPSLCVSVPRVAPRNTTGLPPDVIPLGPLVAGLRLPFAVVTNATATVQVEDRAGGRRGTYAFKGWGLEVAIPPGRTVIDIRADLRASLTTLATAAGSLAAKFRLGPLGLVLRLDASAFAQLLVKLVASLQARIEVDLCRPGIPELTACRPMPGRPRPSGFDFDALSGPATLLVPGRGYGPALVSFAGPRVGSTGLSSAPIPAPADKSTVRTLLALDGALRPVGSSATARELESEWELEMEGEQLDYGFEAEDPFSTSEFESDLELPTYESFAEELEHFA